VSASPVPLHKRCQACSLYRLPQLAFPLALQSPATPPTKTFSWSVSLWSAFLVPPFLAAEKLSQTLEEMRVLPGPSDTQSTASRDHPARAGLQHREHFATVQFVSDHHERLDATRVLLARS
jgi:hypothetical protein